MDFRGPSNYHDRLVGRIVGWHLRRYHGRLHRWNVGRFRNLRRFKWNFRRFSWHLGRYDGRLWRVPERSVDHHHGAPNDHHGAPNDHHHRCERAFASLDVGGTHHGRTFAEPVRRTQLP
jgi:hypothetical protein